MNGIDRIRQVLMSSFPDATFVQEPPGGASEADIGHEEKVMQKQIGKDYRDFLRTWNGLNLDWLKFCGCRETLHGIDRLSELQGSYDDRSVVVFASSPSGCVYFESALGEVYCHYCDGGDTILMGRSFDDFICNAVYGEKSQEFFGSEWFEDLKRAGLIDDY